MVKERNTVNTHLKDIQEKKQETCEVKLAVEEVEIELKNIKENEQEYLRLQKEYYKRMQEQEEENEQNEFEQKNKQEKPKNTAICGMNQNNENMIKKQNEKTNKDFSLM